VPLTADEIKEHQGARIRAARKAAGHTATTFGAAIGVSSTTVFNWESGATSPPVTTQVAIAVLLGVRHSELFGLDEVA